MNTTENCRWCGKCYVLSSRDEPGKRSFPGYINPRSLWCCEKCLYEWEVANNCVGLKAHEYMEWASQYARIRQKYLQDTNERKREGEIREYESGKKEIVRESIILTIIGGLLPCCASLCYVITTKKILQVYTAVFDSFDKGKFYDDGMLVFGPAILLSLVLFICLVRFMFFHLIYRPRL